MIGKNLANTKFKHTHTLSLFLYFMYVSKNAIEFEWIFILSAMMDSLKSATSESEISWDFGLPWVIK